MSNIKIRGPSRGAGPKHVRYSRSRSPRASIPSTRCGQVTYSIQPLDVQIQFVQIGAALSVAITSLTIRAQSLAEMLNIKSKYTMWSLHDMCATIRPNVYFELIL
eukprot:scaffold57313_cov19-Prasinocladus_malaysianus.AAC.1